MNLVVPVMSEGSNPVKQDQLDISQIIENELGSNNWRDDKPRRELLALLLVTAQKLETLNVIDGVYIRVKDNRPMAEHGRRNEDEYLYILAGTGLSDKCYDVYFDAYGDVKMERVGWLTVLWNHSMVSFLGVGVSLVGFAVHVGVLPHLIMR